MCVFSSLTVISLWTKRLVGLFSCYLNCDNEIFLRLLVVGMWSEVVICTGHISILCWVSLPFSHSKSGKRDVNDILSSAFKSGLPNPLNRVHQLSKSTSMTSSYPMYVLTKGAAT